MAASRGLAARPRAIGRAFPCSDVWGADVQIAGLIRSEPVAPMISPRQNEGAPSARSFIHPVERGHDCELVGLGPRERVLGEGEPDTRVPVLRHPSSVEEPAELITPQGSLCRSSSRDDLFVDTLVYKSVKRMNLLQSSHPLRRAR